MKEGDISQLGDYNVPFFEQQYLHGFCYISLFKLKSFDQLIPPKLPQILDIYSVVAPEIRCKISSCRIFVSFHWDISTFCYCSLFHGFGRVSSQ